MNENQLREILKLLSQAELLRANSLPAARVLLSLTRDEKLFSRRDFLTKANRVAVDMWDCLDDGDEVRARKSGGRSRRSIIPPEFSFSSG